MDEKRVLSKIDELDSYLTELDIIKPAELEEYQNSIEKKRAIERLLQVSIETVLDVCNIIISDLKLGLPSDEDDVFNKLSEKNIISKKMAITLSKMKSFRNILVHKYGKVDDEQVYEHLSELEDFKKFKEEILNFLKKQDKENNKKR